MSSFILTKLSPLTAPRIIVLTTPGAASENFAKIAFPLQRLATIYMYVSVIRLTYSQWYGIPSSGSVQCIGCAFPMRSSPLYPSHTSAHCGILCPCRRMSAVRVWPDHVLRPTGTPLRPFGTGGPLLNGDGHMRADIGPGCGTQTSTRQIALSTKYRAVHTA